MYPRLRQLGRSLITAAIALVLAGVPRTAAHASPPSITEITLEDWPGFVMHPGVNKIVLRRDGTCWRLTGKQDQPEKLKGFIRQRDFDWLATRFTGAAFFNMKSRYQPNPMISDMPTVVVSAVRANKRMTVQNYARSGPEVLWQLELLTRGLAETVRWQPVSATPGTTPPPPRPQI